MLQSRTKTLGSLSELTIKLEEGVLKDGWLYMSKRKTSNRFDRRYCVLNKGSSFLAIMKSPKVRQNTYKNKT